MSYPYQEAGSPGGYPYQGDFYHLSLRKHTGALIIFVTETVTVTGDHTQCRAAYKNAQLHNLILGWWSPASILLWNWIALIGNFVAMKKVRKFSQEDQASYGQQAPPIQSPTSPAQSATPAGWYQDPSGQPSTRYWDGTQWTHWTRPPNHR